MSLGLGTNQESPAHSCCASVRGGDAGSRTRLAQIETVSSRIRDATAWGKDAGSWTRLGT